MSTEMTTTTNGNNNLQQMGEMSVLSIVDRKRKLNEVMSAVMQDGVHFGKIPGCGDKPSLFKSGAEVLATVFGLAPTFKVKRTDLPGGHREYEIVCTLKQITSKQNLGEGVGTCSTMESKYRWRAGARKCPSCSKANTIIKGKAEYGGGWLCFAKKGGCGAKFSDGDKSIEDQQTERTENPDIADTYNTVLKMAKKRAQVDATLTAVGASDILTQDLEDMQNREEAAAPAVGPVTAPSSAAAPAAKPSTPPPGLSDDEMENLTTAIGGFSSIGDLRKFFAERLDPASKKATGPQYKILRTAFEAQHTLIEDALANEGGQ